MDNSTFLGQGWAFPPAFVKGTPTVVALSSNEENINEQLQVLFDTRIGARLMEFGYGTELGDLAFSSIDAATIKNIEDTIRRGILLNERRITVTEIEVDISQSRDGVVLVNVQYKVNQTNDRANFVYPFHLTEGTNINL